MFGSALLDILRADAQAARSYLRARWLPVLAFAVVTTYVACRVAPALSSQDFAFLDWLLSTRPARTPDPDIVLVGIERAAIEDFEDRRVGQCTCRAIGRVQIGQLCSLIRQAGARVLLVDLMFSDPCLEKGHDERLKRALSGPGSEVVLSIEADPIPGKLYYRPPSPTVMGEPEPLLGSPVLYQPHGTIRAVCPLQVGVKGRPKSRKGVIPVSGSGEAQEPEDHGVEVVGEVFPSLSAAAYAAFLGQPCDLPTAAKPDELLCAGRSIPVWPQERIHLLGAPPDVRGQESDHAMLINWVGRPGTFPMYSATDVLGRDPSDPQLDAMFRGKVVLLGALDDRAATPMGKPRGRPAAGAPYVDQSTEITMSGIEIHANALDTMLTGRFIRPVQMWVMWLLLVGCSGLTLVVFRSVRAGGAVVVTLLEVLALIVTARALIVQDIWLMPVTPVAAMVATAALAAIWGYAHATRQEVLLRRQLQEIDTATATVVHDLKQPLAAINALAGALRRLQEAGQLSAAPEILERIQRQVDSALGNINEMLLADPDRPITLNLQEFDLTAVARDLATTHALSSRLHEISVRSPDGPAVVTADPQHIGRVLNNLIDNAIRYSPEGGPVVIEVLPGGKHTVLRVADRGLGIPPDKIHAVFDKYERVEHEGHQIPGTGIGLYSVKRLVEAHGGRIGVRSIQGVGTTFTVTLPTRAEGNGSLPK